MICVCRQNADQKFKLVMVLEQEFELDIILNLTHNDKEFAKKIEHKMALFVENFDTLKKVWIKLLYYGDRFFFQKVKSLRVLFCDKGDPIMFLPYSSIYRQFFRILILFCSIFPMNYGIKISISICELIPIA